MKKDIKITIVEELKGILEKDERMDTIAQDMRCMGYAPAAGYRAWSFRYKNVPVLIFDEGNGFYSFYRKSSWIEEKYNVVYRVVFDRFIDCLYRVKAWFEQRRIHRVE